MRVIGAGLPRTGTTSLKAALEQLGFGPCYHMDELIRRPADWPRWTRAFEGGPLAADALCGGFGAIADVPGCCFVRALAEHFPAAKVVLTARDGDSWFRSTQDTVLSPELAEHFAASPPEFNHLMRVMGWHPADPATHDRARMLERLRRQEHEVRAAIAPERLLVYELAQGWAPLCGFLGVPVPAGPVPHLNSSGDFLQMIRSMPGPGVTHP